MLQVQMQKQRPTVPIRLVEDGLADAAEAISAL